MFTTFTFNIFDLSVVFTFEIELFIFSIEDSYSVVLPEKLDTGIWNVHRSKHFEILLFCYVPLVLTSVYMIMIIIMVQFLFCPCQICKVAYQAL